MSKISDLTQKLKSESESELANIRAEVKSVTKHFMGNLNEELANDRKLMRKNILSLSLISIVIGILIAIVMGFGIVIWWQNNKLTKVNEVYSKRQYLQKYQKINNITLTQDKHGKLMIVVPLNKAEYWKNSDNHVIKLN